MRPLGLALLWLLSTTRGWSEGRDSNEWLTVDGNVLELKLAHDDTGGPDGGVLRVDPTAKTLRWNGISGPLGCPHGFEASFGDVRSIKLARGAGFAVMVKNKETFTFIPVPHAQWIHEQWKVAQLPDGLAQAFKDGLLKGPGGESMPAPNGVAGSAGPRLEQVNLPEDVVFDTRLAVESILDALGRTPSPGLKVREALYGNPEDVDVSELLESPLYFSGHAIRVHGRIFERSPGNFELRAGELGVPIIPTKEIATAFHAGVQLGASKDMEITGVFREPNRVSPGPPPSAVGEVAFWDFVRAEPEVNAPGSERVALSLLVGEPNRFAGKTVRVVGKFRGRNLYSDLPQETLGRGAGFVIKDDDFAIWVTGRKAEGKGWTLDPLAPGDTENWVEVIGRPSLHAGIVYLRASQLSITAPPSGQAAVTRPRRLAGGGRLTAAVMFALPLLGEGVARDGLFVVQFNKYMNARTLEGRARLRYIGGDRESSFPRMRVSYDDDRRAVIVDPGELMEAGREIEVLLLSGIEDSDGLPLDTLPGDAEAVYRVRYKVASSAP
jgi:hypothetical protein